MNISQPVASGIESVDFGYLSSADIRALSVKRIQNPVTIDSLHNPVPGGLYDAALGAWLDNACVSKPQIEWESAPWRTYSAHASCSTCQLNTYNCPGHPGHIELPVPLYHPVFFQQLFVLLRARCAYCSHFKLPPLEVNRYVCRLQLIEHGLLDALEQLDHIRPSKSLHADDDDGSGEDADADEIVSRRAAFVRRRIRAKSTTRNKIEAVTDCRRTTIKDFMAACTKPSKCGTCKGISPGLRRNGFNKIFEKSLSAKHKAQMAQLGLKLVNPLLGVQKRQEIDVDSDELPSDEGEGDDLVSNDAKSGPKPVVETYASPQKVYSDAVQLFQQERTLLQLIYKRASVDMFFIHTILVPPTRFRPETRTGDGEIAEATEHEYYKNIIKGCQRIAELRKQSGDESLPIEQRQRAFQMLQATIITLQDSVNTLFDTSRAPSANTRQNVDGIKQRLEKKDGLFRKNMMGKRVNFAARSVISPDPNIDTNEIGVPPVFARKLTYPEPVTNHNFYELKQAVLNGADKWPGAAAVESETGQVISLRTKNVEERQALANQLLAPSSTNVNGSRNKKVHRHLKNGDIVLMNRQPTLHKPSIMAHRTRILPGEKTIRMHYANCNTYNADFDGDEMNMHFPQNELARAEAFEIADTDHQYLVATSGKPLRGLIQDHLSMGVWLTNKDTFFDREDYHQLLCSCLSSDKPIQTVVPALIKPSRRWTGKQIVSTVMRNLQPLDHPNGLTMQGKSQTPGDRWGIGLEEHVVLVQDGDLLCGILDKASLGPTSGGFVHAVYEAYGHTIAGQLLSVLGRLLTKFLHMRAWTCGMDDLKLTVAGDTARRDTLRQAQTIGRHVARKYVGLDDQPEDQNSRDPTEKRRLEEVLRDNQQGALDALYTARVAKLSSEITAVCLPGGLAKPFPHNQMQTMTISGAKGSQVNANQISCNLGQQILEGRRVPVMVSGKTLPSFAPFDTHVRAGGYITNRFLTGVRPQEYYFHAMAGREGLIDTAVKTSRSGYLQRCLIKGMEGLRTEYDRSVRDSDGSLVQFLYGEDGLDVTKQKHLLDFRFILENYMSFAVELNLAEKIQRLNTDGAQKYQRHALKKLAKTGRLDCIDPVTAVFNPGTSIGSNSEKFAAAVNLYSEQNPDNALRTKKSRPEDGQKLKKKAFTALMDVKYRHSLIEPGEAVGLVVGQSIGEPSTQMTLNTFHLAGHAAKNVTLGIPRLREIVMTASRNIPTPNMTLFPIEELSEIEGHRFAKAITKLTLAEIVDHVTVSESISREQAKVFRIRLSFWEAREYCETYAIETEDVWRTMEVKFVPDLVKRIKKELGKSKVVEVGQSSGREKEVVVAADEEDEESRPEKESYDAPDEGEAAIAKQAQSDEDEEERSRSRGSSEDEGGRKGRILDRHSVVANFACDTREGQWCEITLRYDVRTAKLLLLPIVESACHAAVIQSVPGLGVCSFGHEDLPNKATGKLQSVAVVNTQGVNLRAMHEYQDMINPHKLVTNDIWAMMCTYGVEAGRMTIIREMDAVFGGHGITVDQRHLNLIADHMTRDGGFRPFSRIGLASSVSPLQKASFESTLTYLRDAVLDGDWDELKNPSARIVVGKLSGVGTGAFDVLYPIS